MTLVANYLPAKIAIFPAECRPAATAGRTNCRAGWAKAIVPLVLLVCWCACLRPSLGQDPQQQITSADGIGKADPIVPQTEEFRESSEALREHLKKMREIMVRFNTSADPELDKQYRSQWSKLREDGLALHQRMVAAAVQEYLLDPKDRKLADMLWGILDINVEADQYEGMLEVAQALQANGYQQEKLRGALAITSFALNHYDIAKEQVNALIEEGAADPKLLNLRDDADEVKREWENELRVRQEDAQGPPLPRVLIHTTKGDILVELFENQAPETVGNFIHLVESGFYEGLTFHRVISNFMAQVGCPIGDGTGGPGYTIYGEMKKPGARKFFRGTLGMALAQDPNSAGSQFFISYIPTYELNDDYTAFGRVLSGMQVVGNLVRVNPDEKKEEGAPVEMPDEIISIEVLNKRDHEYLPNKVPN